MSLNNLAPSITVNLGASDRKIASVYLVAGTYDVRAILGALATSGTATLTIKSLAGANLATLTTTTGPAAVGPAELILASDQWVEFFIKHSSWEGSVVCTGISIEA